MRAGQFIRQVEGYRAFVPAPLPPDPLPVLDSETINLMSRADRATDTEEGHST